MPKYTHDVVVHKANVPLARGESLRAYTAALSEAGRQHAMQKLNLIAKSGDVFMVEAYSDSAIFEVYKYGEEGQAGKFNFYATKYSRDKNGNFSFGDLLEVQRVTSFKPKTEFEVTKSGEGFWTGLL